MESIRFERAGVFGATGVTGRAITGALLERRVPVQVISRSESNLAAAFQGTDASPFVADVMDAESTRRAAEDCDLLVCCVGVPLPQFERHLTIAEHLMEAAQKTGGRLLLVTGYWSFAPMNAIPATEDQPRSPATRAGRIRKAQEDLILAADGAVAVLPDFYGPGCSTKVSMLNGALASLLQGKKILWPGDPDAPREFLYVPDCGPVLADLAARPEAYGNVWNVSGAGPVRPRALLEQAATKLEKTARIKRVGRGMVRLAGLFNAGIRAFGDVYPIYAAPAALDGTKIRELLGEIPVTPYVRGVRATLDELRGG